KVDVAAHSPQMETLRPELVAALAEMRPQPASIPVYSTVEPTRQPAFAAEYWGRNLRQPVLFAEAVQRALADGLDTFIELSPHPILLQPIAQSVSNERQSAIVTAPSLRREADEPMTLLASLGMLYASGYAVDWQRLYPAGQVVSLPTYPWQRERFWLETQPANTALGAGLGIQKAEHPLLGYHLSELAHLPNQHVWQTALDGRFRRYVREQQLDTPESIFAAMALAAATATYGRKLHRVSACVVHDSSALPTSGEASLQIVLIADEHETASFQIFRRDHAESAWQAAASGRIALSLVEADWLYEVAWQPLPLPDSVRSDLSGTWIVFARNDALSATVAQHIADGGGVCVRALPGKEYIRAADHYTIDPNQPAHFQQLIDDALGVERPACRGILHLWGADSPAIDAVTTEAMQDAQRLACGSALYVVHALAQAKWPPQGAPRLWLITRGAQFTAGPSIGAAPNPIYATLWGLGRVIAAEHPELWGGLIDLDAQAGADEATLLLQTVSDPGNADQIAFRQGQRQAARLARRSNLTAPLDALTIRPDASYLITGGLSGLGLKTARWLVARGARHLALMGRTPRPDAARELEHLGAQVLIVQGDVSRADDAARALTEIERKLPPLRGIIHSAGVVDDAMLMRQDWTSFENVMAAKVAGAWNLHTLTTQRGLPLDLFVLFSSAASLLGTLGQGNYAAANAFLDALAHHRRALGLPASCINWGAWGEVGLAVQADRSEQLSRRGIDAMTAQQGIAALERVLELGAPQLAVLAVRWGTFLAQHPRGHQSAYFAELAREAQVTDPAGMSAPRSDILQQLEQATAGERYDLLLDHVRSQVITVMRFGRETMLEPDQGFFRLGMDSLMAVELKNRLQSSLGCALRSTLAFDYPTLAALTQYLFAELFPAEANATTPEAPAAADDLPVEIQSLSGEEVKALLEQELQSLSEGL
ncbi:MAG TPA: SDR family NAD(P)-dependent oxidoreductase, partial [Anaerolineae bacterium]|nr:SDR family NAD(P)-dependent oxidoreductase [Anaerolineae bacterium]